MISEFKYIKPTEAGSAKIRDSCIDRFRYEFPSTCRPLFFSELSFGRVTTFKATPISANGSCASLSAYISHTIAPSKSDDICLPTTRFICETPLAKLMGIDFKNSCFEILRFGFNPDKFTEVKEIPFNLHAMKTITQLTKPEANTARQRL